MSHQLKNNFKIGLFIDSPSGGGAFQYCMSMIEGVKHLQEKGYQVIIVYTHSEWASYLEKIKIPSKKVPSHNFLTRILNRINFNSLSVPVRKYLLSLFHPIPHILSKEKCDVWIFPSRNEWSYLSGVPSLPVIHDLMHIYENFPECREGGEYERRERINKNICTRTFGVIVDSEVGKQQFQESYAMEKDKIHILPFVPPTYIFNNPRPDFKEKFNMPDKYVYYPAHFWPHKNHINLIEAINILVKEIPDIYLVLTGSTSESHYSEVEKNIKKYSLEEKIRILGYVPEEYMADFYRHATMLVMATFCGPTNIPPIEAFAVGCPVAASGVYGMIDQVGKAGLLFDPNSPESIAESIRKLWNNQKLRTELIEAGYKKAKEYDQTHFNSHLEKIIHKILN